MPQLACTLSVEGVFYEAEVTFFDESRSARLDAFRTAVGKDGTLERQPFEEFDEEEDFSGGVGEVVG